MAPKMTHQEPTFNHLADGSDKTCSRCHQRLCVAQFQRIQKHKDPLVVHKTTKECLDCRLEKADRHKASKCRLATEDNERLLRERLAVSPPALLSPDECPLHCAEYPVAYPALSMRPTAHTMPNKPRGARRRLMATH
jgi:hypothetical protein